MKRTVKARVIIQRSGCVAHNNAVWGVKVDALSDLILGERVVRCTITYDDGKPRKRRKGAK